MFSAYLALTVFLALKGMKKTKNFSSFALGKRDMGPWLVGITLASSIASTATFIINPGFVYQHGVAALMHFAVASPAGFLLALFLFSKKFRQLGERNTALTLPDWIRKRYNHPVMGSYFAFLNLILSVTFIVLIVKGSALIMQHTLGLTYFWSLILIVGVVFSYIMLGGTYAHAYTNAFQGTIMVAVALLIFFSGLHYFSDGFGAFFGRLSAIDENLVKVINPASPLFGNVWEVFICCFLISMGLVCQPHILMKPMYLKEDRQVNKMLLISALVSLAFVALLWAGLYARLTLGSDMPSQDAVMPIYISKVFSPTLGVFVSIALLAAGMSTLDGILVGVSTIAANDLVLGPVGERFFGKMNAEAREKLALSFSRWILFAVGLISLWIALDPPKLVGLFAQAGIYGLTAASLVPIAGGIFFRHLSANKVFVSSVIGPAVHFAVYFYYQFGLDRMLNPAVSASWGIAASVATMALLSLVPGGVKGMARAASLRR